MLLIELGIAIIKTIYSQWDSQHQYYKYVSLNLNICHIESLVYLAIFISNIYQYHLTQIYWIIINILSCDLYSPSQYILLYVLFIAFKFCYHIIVSWTRIYKYSNFKNCKISMFQWQSVDWVLRLHIGHLRLIIEILAILKIMLILKIILLI